MPMLEYPFNNLYPFCFIGEYENGKTLFSVGDSEEECIENLGNEQEEFGKLVFYSAYHGNGYVDGEYIGEDEGDD